MPIVKDKLVVDANILFAMIIKNSKTSDIILSDNFELITPAFVHVEFEKYKSLLLDKTSRNQIDIDDLLDLIFRKVKTVVQEDYEEFMPKARKLTPDPKDADYFAVALKEKCTIWSNDKKLKTQNVVNIISTSELLEK